MPKYRITMIKNGASTVVIYVEKANAKVAYDDAIAGAAYIFGPPDPNKPHVVNVIEESTV